MNKFKHFQVTNGMSFGNLDLNLDSPGMNLIMGENLDDTSGNSSRNGCGKSNIFTLLNYHLYEKGLDLVNFRSKSGIIKTEAGKDYMSKLVWNPAALASPEFLTSYQYQKFQDWGSGAYLIKNGSWEEFAAGKEGTDDLSSWQIKDTQRSFADNLNLTWNEWNLLVNLTNVDDDKDDPFFTNQNKIQRLEIFQSLFKMDYSAAHQEVKTRLSDLRRQIDKDNTAIESALAVLKSQLEELQTKEELEDAIKIFTASVDKYSQAAQRLNSQIESREAKLQLLVEFDQLKDALIQSGIEADKFTSDEVSVAYNDYRSGVETAQQNISDLRVQITQLQQYENLKVHLDNAEQSAAFYINEGYTTAGIREKSSENQDLISKQYRYQQLTSKYSWLSEYESNIQSAAINISQNRLQMAKDLSTNLAASSHTKSELNNQRSSHTFMLGKLFPKVKQLLGELEQAQSGVEQFNEYAAFESAQAELEPAQKGQYEIKLKLQEAKAAVTKTQHDIEHMSSGVCPTCNQQLPDFEDTEKARKDLDDQLIANQQVVTDLEQQIVQSDEELLVLKDKAIKFNQYLSATVSLNSVQSQLKEQLSEEEIANLSYEYLEEETRKSQLRLSDIDIELADLEKEHRLVAGQIQQLNTAIDDELAFIADHSPVIVSELEAENTRLGNVAQILNGLEQQRTNMVPIQANVQTLLDAEYTVVSLQALLEENTAYLQGAREYITWAEAVLPMLAQINDSKFSDIESVRWMMEGDSSNDDRESLSNIQEMLNNDQNALSNAKYALKQRADLETRIKQQEDLNEDLMASRKRYKALQALEIMCGPNGLVYSRLEIIFAQLNAIMNNYMSILIPEGNSINRQVTTYFEMTSDGPIQTVYRGDAPIARLSKSEKARVKLARTLGLREFSLPAKQCNILLLDEMDGSACDTNKERIWECVHSHVERFPETSVFAVSHSQQMQESDMWDKVFKVVKKDSYSTLVEVN